MAAMEKISNRTVLSAARRKALQVSHKDLKRSIILDCGLMDSLYSLGVINDTAMEDIMLMRTPNEQVGQLLGYIGQLSNESYQQFLDALKESDHSHIVDMLEKAEIKTTEDEDGVDGLSVDVQSDQKSNVVNKVMDILKEYYIEKNSYLQLLGWTDQYVKLDDIFVDIKLARLNKSGRENGQLNFKDWLHGQRVVPKRIVLQGPPGIGKSTLLNKLCFDWSTENIGCPWSEVHLVFLLPLRNLESAPKSLLDMIDQTGLIPSDELSCLERRDLESYVNANPNKVVILLDGWDELDSSLHRPLLEFWNGKLCRKIPFVVTTRPEYQKVLQPKSTDDFYFHVQGFEQFSKEILVRKYFSENEDIGEDKVKSLSEKSNEFLSPLTQNPQNLTLLCMLYEEMDGSLPGTQTEIISETVLSLIRRDVMKTDEDHEDISNMDDLPSHIKDIVMSMGVLAFTKTNTGVFAFDDKEIKTRQFQNKGFGLLTCEKDANFRKTGNKWKFINASIQEFLAAYWLVQTGNYRRKDLLHNLATKQDTHYLTTDKETLDGVCRFTCGILGGNAADFLTVLLELKERSICSLWIDCILEAMDNCKTDSCETGNNGLQQLSADVCSVIYETDICTSCNMLFRNTRQVTALCQLIARKPESPVWTKMETLHIGALLQDKVSDTEKNLFAKLEMYKDNLLIVKILHILRHNRWITNIITHPGYMAITLSGNQDFHVLEWMRTMEVNDLWCRQMALVVAPETSVHTNESSILSAVSFPQNVKLVSFLLEENVEVIVNETSESPKSSQIQELMLINQSDINMLSHDTFKVHPEVKYLAIIDPNLEKYLPFLTHTSLRVDLQCLLLCTVGPVSLQADTLEKLKGCASLFLLLHEHTLQDIECASTCEQNTQKIYQHITIGNVPITTESYQKESHDHEDHVVNAEHSAVWQMLWTVDNMREKKSTNAACREYIISELFSPQSVTVKALTAGGSCFTCRLWIDAEFISGENSQAFVKNTVPDVLPEKHLEPPRTFLSFFHIAKRIPKKKNTGSAKCKRKKCILM